MLTKSLTPSVENRYSSRWLRKASAIRHERTFYGARGGPHRGASGIVALTSSMSDKTLRLNS